MQPTILVRKLGRSDTSLLRDHLLRLDPPDRRLRFQGAVSDARIEDYAAGIDWDEAVLLGAFVAGRLRGVAELAIVRRGWPREAEAAFSIESAFQNRGIGTALLRRLMLIARNRGIGRMHMICLIENRRMQRLARKCGCRLSFEADEVTARVDPPLPSTASLLLEAADDGLALLQDLFATSELATDELPGAESAPQTA